MYIHEEIILAVLPILNKYSAIKEGEEFDYTVNDLIVDMNRACCAIASFNKRGIANLHEELKCRAKGHK